MARTLFGIFLLWLLSVSHVTAGSAQIDYPLTRLTDNVYVIFGPLELPDEKNQGFRNNIGIIQTSKGVVISDPGGSASAGEMVVRKVKTLTKKPIVAVFNSHAHGDHWLGNEAIKKHYPSATIYGHPNMKKKVESAEGTRWVDMINQRTKNTANGKRAVAPDNTVNDGDLITIGDTKFRVHHTGRAHSDNDIMVEVIDQKILFTGDVVRNGMLGLMNEDASFVGNINAIDVILKKEFDLYIPGHGKSGRHEIAKNYRNYLNIVYTSVKKMYAQGLADFEMKKTIKKSVSRYKNWVAFDMLLGPSISRAYLEVEAEEFQ
ncbi:MAG: MBL fold metallo-hydrolase [Gammaproteobacteria bacterium]